MLADKAKILLADLMQKEAMLRERRNNTLKEWRWGWGGAVGAEGSP